MTVTCIIYLTCLRRKSRSGKSLFVHSIMRLYKSSSFTPRSSSITKLSKSRLEMVGKPAEILFKVMKFFFKINRLMMWMSLGQNPFCDVLLKYCRALSRVKFDNMYWASVIFKKLILNVSAIFSRCPILVPFASSSKSRLQVYASSWGRRNKILV